MTGMIGKFSLIAVVSSWRAMPGTGALSLAFKMARTDLQTLVQSESSGAFGDKVAIGLLL